MVNFLLINIVSFFKELKPEKVTAPSGIGTVDDYWPAAKKLLGDLKFMESMLQFDKDNIPPAVIKKLEDRVLNNENFDPEKVKVASTACEGLYKWVIAIVEYDVVAKVVAPKKQALADAQNQFNAAMKVVAEKQSQLAQVEANLDRLTTLLQEQKDMYAKLQGEHDSCTQKLIRATEIIQGLGGEKSRWQEMAEMFGNTFITLTGDILIASSVIAYLGPFTTEFRHSQILEWIEKCKAFGIVCARFVREH